MTARLVEASHWVFFDVIAESAATAAAVAMALRELLPSATIPSQPSDAPSGEEGRPHVLHCRGALPGATPAQAREAIEAALRSVRALAAADGSARAHVAFRDEDSSRSARSARNDRAA